MKGRAGYSLVEVMIAFVIMTMVLSALIPGQAALLGRATVAEDDVLALDYAMSLAAGLGVEDPLTPGQTQDVYRDWQVSIDVVPGDQMAGKVALMLVRITISDQSGRHLATFETLEVAP